MNEVGRYCSTLVGEVQIPQELWGTETVFLF